MAQSSDRSNRKHGDASRRDASRGGRPARWAHAGLDRLPFEPEDLSEDWRLANCAWTEVEGHRCPQVGTYPVLRRIGAGGMGDVYAGIHPRLGTAIAIKLLRDDMARRDDGIRKRFLREAQLAAQLSGTSPHLVHMLDVDVDEATSSHFLVMEYVDGISARQWSVWVHENVGPVSERDALEVCLGATTGLAVAHRAGVIHRDVKSDNILLPKRGGEPAIDRAKLADLGLARDEHADTTVTQTGVQMIGTPGFAAPEQLESAGTARKPADVFGMGATLYELLTGAAPFPGSTPMARAVATMRGEYVPITDLRPGVSDAVQKLLENCLQHDPDKRYPDADALREALQVCHAAAQGRSSSESFTMKVMDLLQKSEVGRAVSSALASGARSELATLNVTGGPPGATLHLVRIPDEEEEEIEDEGEAFELDDDGRAVAADLEPGEYKLTARHRYHHDFTGRVRLRQAADTHFLLNMREKIGSVSLDSEPRGASVRSGDQRLGRTPLRRARLPAGRHTLVVELEGHGTVHHDFELADTGHQDLGSLTLHPRSRADLSDQPGEVEFLLDGRPLADGEEIEPGAHELRARRPGYASQILSVEVAEGAPLRPGQLDWRLNAWALIEHVDRWRDAGDIDRNRAASAVASGLGEFTFLGLHEYDSVVRFGPLAVLRHAPTELEFVLLPGGSFHAGSPPDESGRRADERLHERTVGPFLIARTPLTQAAWKSAGAPNASSVEGSDLPVTDVDWRTATEVCDGLGFALPTEAQWEYACRGGSESAYAFGDDPGLLTEYGWSLANSGDRPHAVGTKRPNGVGLHDVHGGVWEWCRSPYHEFWDERAETDDDALESRYRVFRGGSWSSPPTVARSAYRGAYRDDLRAPDLGLRPVVRLRRESLEEEPS